MVLKQFLSIAFIFLFCLNIQAQSWVTNVNFEASAPGSYSSANAVSGWTVSSQTVTSCVTSTVWTPGSPEFSIVATPVIGLPVIGTLMPSPLGGSLIAQINDLVPNTGSTKISHNYSVTMWDYLFCFSYATFQRALGMHSCCDQTKIEIIAKDCSGNIIPSFGLSRVPASQLCATGYSLYNFSYSVPLSSYLHWSGWTTTYHDLSAYIGSCVTIEVTSSDCSAGCDFGTLFFDANTVGFTGSANFPAPIIFQPNPVRYCPQSSSTATILAPLGFSTYSWSGPNGPIIQSPSNSSTLIIPSASVNSVYTVNLTSSLGYTSYLTYTIASSAASIVSIGSNPTCPLVASGSASVLATGGDSNFSYTWYNSLAQIVSTTQVASNLPAGDYSVSVLAINGDCAASSATVTVGSTSVINTSSITQPFCQNQSAYLYAPPGGSNYQWYDNTSPIAANQGGNLSNYTVLSGSNGAVYPVSYLNANGCKDSVRFYLNPTSPGVLSLTSNSIICQNTSNGAVTFSLSPAANSPAASISYSLFSLPSISTFSSSTAASSITGYTFNTLQAGTSYSLLTFDGICKYSATLTPNVYVTPGFNITNSAYNLCPGQYALAQASFPNQWPPILPQLTYSWSPTTFLSGSNSFAAQITPTIAPGTSTTITYTLSAINPLYNCPPSSNTLTISAFNITFPTPSISPIPSFCANSPSLVITAVPPGGSFYSLFGVSSTYTIFPSMYPSGPQSLTYGFSNACHTALSSSPFTIHPLPTLTISGTTSVCAGESATIAVSGGNSYTWGTGSTSTILALTPGISTSFSVMGISSASCSNTASILITVHPLPTVTAIGTKTICHGSSATVTAVGANYFYNWSTGSSVNTIVLSPTVTTTYTLSGGNSTMCTDTELVTITVQACDPTNIKELRNTSLLKVYPNPGRGQFFIEANVETDILIMDALGRTISEQSVLAGKHSLDLSTQNDGIYFLKYTQNNNSKTIKLIKN